MNLNNVNKAIAVMERVKARGDAFDLRSWQGPFGGVDWDETTPLATEEDLHNCGTPACFAGWLAVSPEFQTDGGSVGGTGCPLINGYQEDEAIASWMGIDEDDAAILCGINQQELVYPVNTNEVTVDHVLEALYRLRDTGSCLLPEYR